jgi:hypothetical protein
MILGLGLVVLVAGCTDTIKCPDIINVGDPCPPAACILSDTCGCSAEHTWSCGAASVDMAATVPHDMSTPPDLVMPPD